MTDPIGTAQERELIERCRNYATALTYSMQSEEARQELGDLRCGPHMAANALIEAADSLQSRIAEVERLTAALDLARNRLRAAAINEAPAQSKEYYEYSQWADEADAALSQHRRPT